MRLFAGKVGGVQYQSGLIAQLPVPIVTSDEAATMSELARRGWSLKRSMDIVDEVSHAFVLPKPLALRCGIYRPDKAIEDLAGIQRAIDEQVIDLYRLNASDKALVFERNPHSEKLAFKGLDDDEVDIDHEQSEADVGDALSGFLSWCVGVAFGRFMLRVATGERAVPPDPGPFDSLPPRVQACFRTGRHRSIPTPVFSLTPLEVPAIFPI